MTPAERAPETHDDFLGGGPRRGGHGCTLYVSRHGVEARIALRLPRHRHRLERRRGTDRKRRGTMRYLPAKDRLPRATDRRSRGTTAMWKTARPSRRGKERIGRMKHRLRHGKDRIRNGKDRIRNGKERRRHGKEASVRGMSRMPRVKSRVPRVKSRLPRVKSQPPHRITRRRPATDRRPDAKGRTTRRNCTRCHGRSTMRDGDDPYSRGLSSSPDGTYPSHHRKDQRSRGNSRMRRALPQRLPPITPTTRQIHPARNASPPSGVIAPSHRTPLSDSA
jgi:hypothetical protein